MMKLFRILKIHPKPRLHEIFLDPLPLSCCFHEVILCISVPWSSRSSYSLLVCTLEARLKQNNVLLPCRANQETFLGHLLRTQNVSEKIQKHFLRLGPQILRRAHTGKHLRPQQCFCNNVFSFAEAFSQELSG